jgi:hypothetical protein
MRRTWLVLVMVLLVVAGVAGVTVTTLHLLHRPEPTGHGARPRDVCERVSVAPLARVHLSEPDYRRTVRQTTDEGVPTATCELTLRMDDVAAPADRSAILFVHVTHFADTGAAEGDFAAARRTADEPSEVTGVADEAFVSFTDGAGDLHEVELRARHGVDGLIVHVVAVRATGWDRDAIRTALAQVARQTR